MCFGVPIRAFFPDDEPGAALAARPTLLRALRDPQGEALALRASGLLPRMLRMIAAIVERAREIEGPEDSDAAADDLLALCGQVWARE